MQSKIKSSFQCTNDRYKKIKYHNKYQSIGKHIGSQDRYV